MKDERFSLSFSQQDFEVLKSMAEKAKTDWIDEFLDVFYTTLAESEQGDLISDQVEDILAPMKQAFEKTFEGKIEEDVPQILQDAFGVLIKLGIPASKIVEAYSRMVNWLVTMEEATPEQLSTMVKVMFVWFKATLDALEESLSESLELIEEISTPVQLVWDRILSLVLVGRLDSQRFSIIMENVLTAVGRYEARIFLMDVGGVEHIDSDVASHLMRMIQAINLMGTETVVVGITPTFSKAIVRLDMDYSHLRMRTFATFKQGLTYAFEQVGVKVVKEG